MGLFGRFTYSHGEWHAGDPESEPYLAVDIHDSDIATVDYRPADRATGRFYLGFEPRLYFDDESANDPIETAEEAQAFAHWVRRVTGREVDAGAIQRLMAKGDPDEEPEDEFVEDTVQRLLALAGLPVPEELAGLDAIPFS